MATNPYIQVNPVAWHTIANEVVQLTEQTETDPATYRITVAPIDTNDVGAGEKDVAYYFKDYIGTTGKIIAYDSTTIDVEDSFRRGFCPVVGKTAVIYKSIEEDSPYLAPIFYRFLSQQALEYSRQIEEAVLWNDLLHVSAIEDTKGITGFVNPSDIEVQYNWTNRTITLTGVLDYYWRGRLHALTSPWTSSAHENTVGRWFLESVDGINFVWSSDIWSFSDIQVSVVNYRATAAESFATCETHGTMDWLSHEENHQVNGTYLLSGGKATAGTYTLDTATDAANSPGFDAARLKDEDRETNIAALPEGTYTTMYIGASNAVVFNIAATLPFISAGSYIQVNNPLTGAMTAGINLRFYNVYQILIPVASDANSQKFRMVFIQPQKTFSSQEEAELEDVNGLILGELDALTPESKTYTRLTYKTSAGDSNTGKCRLISITYVLGTKGNPINVGGVVPTNHAALSNLVWADSAHTGTANKIAGFGVGGEAVYKDEGEPIITAGTTAQYWRGDKTWQSLLTAIHGTVLTGLSTASAVAIIATDTILQAFGKLQALINNLINEDIAFEFADVIAGTAKDYTLDIKASYGYTIESACLETDTGTLTGVAVKIGSTAVTGLSSITVDSSVDETSATAAKTVVVGNRVTLSVSTGYSGAPTLIRGKIKIKRT